SWLPGLNVNPQLAQIFLARVHFSQSNHQRKLLSHAVYFPGLSNVLASRAQCYLHSAMAWGVLLLLTCQKYFRLLWQVCPDRRYSPLGASSHAELPRIQSSGFLSCDLMDLAYPSSLKMNQNGGFAKPDLTP